jgi:hypothetical protein
MYYQRIDSGSEETKRRTSRTFVRLYCIRSTEGTTILTTITSEILFTIPENRNYDRKSWKSVIRQDCGCVILLMSSKNL